MWTHFPHLCDIIIEQTLFIIFFLIKVPSHRNVLNGDLDNPDAEDLEEHGGQVPTWRLQEWTKQVWH